MDLFELSGWLGSILLAFCGLPQAVDSFRRKSSEGVTWGLLGMWGLGEVLTLAYVVPKLEWPLLFNYSMNIIFISVITYYKINRRSGTSPS
jgi:uncharacterized protein with PQ loop repeat